MNKKIIAILLASTITFGWLPASAYAYSTAPQTRIESTNYKTGTYEVSNSILKIDADSDSAARRYIDEKSTITINKNDMTASLTFNQKSLMSNIVVKVNGSEISYTSVEEGTKNLKITFNLNSVNDKIEVSSLINTGFFKMNVSFRVVFDTSSLPIEEAQVQEGIYKNGTYKINNSILKTDADTDSAARRYIDSKSTVVINNSTINTSVVFNQRSLMSDIKVKVNGNEVSYISAEEGDSNLKINFDLASLEDNIEISSTINTGFFKMNVSFRVLLDTIEIPKNESASDDNNSSTDKEENTDDNNNNGNGSSENTHKPSTPQPPVQTPPQQPAKDPSVPETPVIQETPEEEKAPVVSAPPSSGTNQNYSIYQIKNEILTSSAVGYSAARAAVNSTSYVEKIDGKLYVTLGISQLDVMSNIRVYVNGTKVNYEILRKSDTNHTMDIIYSVNSLSDSVNISAHINMMAMDISFGIDLLEDTMTPINSTSAAKPLAQKTESNVLLATNSNSNSSSEETTSADSDTSSETEDTTIDVKSYFKKYTIENDIISDSSIGKSMARKYVDKTCILEDIDGQLYLTIVLSDSSAMSNIKIKVNNENVSYSKSVNSGKTSYKFKIGSITDDIKMSMTITVVNKEVEFGIDLLDDTMTLVEEKTIEQEEKAAMVTKAAPSSDNITTAASNTNVPKIILITFISTTLLICIIEGMIFTYVKKRKKS